MMKAGMPNHQPGQISAATFGPARPVGKNDTEAGKSSNRRIEIVLLPDLTILPGYDELMEKHGRRRPRNRKPTAKPPKKP
jgi:chemotaxis protein MotB